MLVKELIENLQAFPEDMEVCVDSDDGYCNYEIYEIIIANKWYEEDYEKVVVLK